jgi:hypothetical protein
MEELSLEVLSLISTFSQFTAASYCCRESKERLRTSGIDVKQAGVDSASPTKTGSPV